jgi:EAL domain-containing protein (putative c-di-GMP-specific phosphodiesterase class I)
MKSTLILLAVIDAGVHYGQGYYFAEPSFPPPTPTGSFVRAKPKRP